MNSKKAKRDKEESLLISYSGLDHDRSSESESNVPPLDLPPTRLRRPRSRKLHIAQPPKTCCSLWNAVQMVFVIFTVGTMVSMLWFTLILKTSMESMRKRITSYHCFYTIGTNSKIHQYRRRCGCCRACASVFLSVLLLASVLCVVVLGWFSLRLKRDIDFMKKRLSKVESFDRSTSREYESFNDDLTKKFELLRGSNEDSVKQENEQYESILRQIAYLNSTVTDLQEKVKLPEGAHAISSDIESLKKGMADTGGDITEVKDKIKQLTSLAGLQHDKVDEVSLQLYNLSLQVAKMTGNPAPKSPLITSTPPLILRMPVGSDESGPVTDDKSSLNVTSIVAVEVARVMGIVATINNTLSSEVQKLKYLMKSMLEELQKNVATVDDVQNKVLKLMKPQKSKVLSRGHLELDSGEDVWEHVHNLSSVVKKLSLGMDQHSTKMAQLELELVQLNTTISSQKAIPDVSEEPEACNCTVDANKLWQALSLNKQNIKAVQEELKALQKDSRGSDSGSSVEIALEAPSEEILTENRTIVDVPKNETTETTTEELEKESPRVATATAAADEEEEKEAKPLIRNSTDSTLITQASLKLASNRSEAHDATLNSTVKTVTELLTNATTVPNITSLSTHSSESKLNTEVSKMVNETVTHASIIAEEKLEESLEGTLS